MSEYLMKGDERASGLNLLQIEVDAILLSVMSARLVEKINKGFKFTIGQPIMTEAMNQGRFIKKGIKCFKAADKLKFFSAAAGALDALSYGVEVALCAGKVTAEEKAVFDSQFNAVQSQLQAMTAAQAKRVSESEARPRPAKQSSDGNASEATSA